MAWEEDLRARLLGLPALAAITDKVSWYDLPRGLWRAAVLLTDVAPGESWTHEGPMALANPRVQFDCYAEAEADARTLGRIIKAELQRTDEVTIGETIFQPPAQLNIRLRSREELAGSDSQPARELYRVLQDFSFFTRPAN
jgi:hypothetical protein